MEQDGFPGEFLVRVQRYLKASHPERAPGERGREMPHMRMSKRSCLTAAAGVGLIVSVTGCFADGSYAVGNKPGQIAPGLYTSATPLGANCQLDRRFVNSLSDFGLQSNGGRNFIQIPAQPNQIVTSAGCGVWVTPKATSYNPDRATAKFGSYRIPTDLLPGTYVAPGAPGCAWQLVSNFTANPQSILGTIFETAGKQPRVTITSADGGFNSNPCGGWKRIGP
ncbi:MAG TPA: hypothetical protein VHX15_21495 [Frankiaceae bacterium]|nr:hypothetical protein [Frankiaceae bacterium]